MKTRKRTIILVCWLVAMLLTGTGCTRQKQAVTTGGVLMEESTAPWTKVVETSCKIQGFGKPVGTVKETLLETADSWEVTFSIDEEMTQTMVDGYAQAVWRACEMRSGEANRSGSGSRYDSMEEAEKRQEPLNYYIWYYRAGEETFRLGLYPTNMETGVPGGLVLRIERWA